LMINMLHEKIFLFLWWWFLMVTIITILNFIYWLVASSIGAFRKEFLERMLNAQGINIQSEDRAVFNSFANNLVGSDGVVVLRLLARNAGEMVGSKVVATLWNMSKEDLKKQRGYQGSPSLDEKYSAYH